MPASVLVDSCILCNILCLITQELHRHLRLRFLAHRRLIIAGRIKNE